jgi:hypothetical protein
MAECPWFNPDLFQKPNIFQKMLSPKFILMIFTGQRDSCPYWVDGVTFLGPEV